MIVADIRARLLGKDKEQLADIIISLVVKMTEMEKKEFEKKYVRKDSEQGAIGHENADSAIDAVDKFCKKCLDGEYTVEADYDEYYDFYDEEAYEDSPWAVEFAYYFQLAQECAEIGDNKMAYELFTKLFDCLSKTRSDYEALGTSEPLEYIQIDFQHMFEVYFSVIKSSLNIRDGYLQMLSIWERFQDYCTGLMYDSITDLDIAYEVFLSTAKECDNCVRGESILMMLNNLHENCNKKFDKRKAATELLSIDKDYSLYAAWSYYENAEYAKTIEIATKYMDMVDIEIASGLKRALMNAYRKSGHIAEAYKVCYEVFQIDPDYTLYKRLRHLSSTFMEFDEFFCMIEKDLLESNNWKAREVYRDILSFEGKIDKLISLLPSKVSSDYDSVKYTIRSIVYRAVRDQEMLAPNLAEFVSRIIDESLGGIVDTVPKEPSAAEKTEYLSKAIEMIKDMVAYHIQAGTRSRYERAAYYISVAWDIWSFLDKQDEATEYINLLLAENKRRPEFKGEVRKRLMYI